MAYGYGSYDWEYDPDDDYEERKLDAVKKALHELEKIHETRSGLARLVKALVREINKKYKKESL